MDEGLVTVNAQLAGPDSALQTDMFLPIELELAGPDPSPQTLGLAPMATPEQHASGHTARKSQTAKIC